MIALKNGISSKEVLLNLMALVSGWIRLAQVAQLKNIFVELFRASDLHAGILLRVYLCVSIFISTHCTAAESKTKF